MNIIANDDSSSSSSRSGDWRDKDDDVCVCVCVCVGMPGCRVQVYRACIKRSSLYVRSLSKQSSYIGVLNIAAPTGHSARRLDGTPASQRRQNIIVDMAAAADQLKHGAQCRPSGPLTDRPSHAHSQTPCVVTVRVCRAVPCRPHVHV